MLRLRRVASVWVLPADPAVRAVLRLHGIGAHGIGAHGGGGGGGGGGGSGGGDGGDGGGDGRVGAEDSPLLAFAATFEDARVWCEDFLLANPHGRTARTFEAEGNAAGSPWGSRDAEVISTIPEGDGVEVVAVASPAALAVLKPRVLGPCG